MVGLINQYFTFSSGLTVFIHHSRRLDHPGAVKGLSKRLLVHMESLCYQVGVGGGCRWSTDHSVTAECALTCEGSTTFAGIWVTRSAWRCFYGLQ